MRKHLIRLSMVLLIMVACASVLWANTALELNTETVSNDKLPINFIGFRIAHVSDLHSAQIGKDNEKLLNLLRQAEPDIIAITGDLADSRDTDLSIALHFAAEAVKIAPCYYVTGNHEVRLQGTLYNDLLEGLVAAGVTVLNDEEIILTREGECISITGHWWGTAENVNSISNFSGYRILLAHAPEDIEAYAAAGFDFVLSGHAHGGQFRLPFIGGVYAPGQGFFPAYDGGCYAVGDTIMIVSRGIGNQTNDSVFHSVMQNSLKWCKFGVVTETYRLFKESTAHFSRIIRTFITKVRLFKQLTTAKR